VSIYADTSLLVSYYISDANSVAAQTSITALASPLFFTGLHRLELSNALELGVFRKVLTRGQAQAALADVKKDLQGRRLIPQPVNWAPVMRMAVQWAGRYTATVGTRSLDLLHVAVARKMNATEFYSFDTRQRVLAQLLGFTVKP
jgi:predicted nucleic acid-binding protein